MRAVGKEMRWGLTATYTIVLRPQVMLRKEISIQLRASVTSTTYEPRTRS